MTTREAVKALRPVVRALLPWCLNRRSGSVEVVFSDGVPKHAHRREVIELRPRTPPPKPAA